jgi:hypothetical protein
MTGFRIPPPDIGRAVSQATADRDRVVDLLRAWSILVVVGGHSLMAVVVWREGTPRLGNTLASYAWLQPATWFLQVLPIFFMVGATANAYSWTGAQGRAQPYPTWIWRRVQRLLRPVIPYFVIMAGIGFLIGWLGDPREAGPLLQLTTQLLWFLGAYLWVTAATPWFVRLRDSDARHALIGLLGAVAAIDVVRFALDGPAALGLLNFLIVWMLAGLLGVHLGRPLSRGRAVLLVGASLVANGLLVALADYPVSLVGMPGDEISNMDPPTLVLALHTFTLFGLISLLRPLLTRIAARPRVWRATVAVNMLMMSIYLWHLPVLTALTYAEHALGWERPTSWMGAIGPEPAAGFWPWTMVHLAVFVTALFAVLRIVWITEYARLPWWDAESRRVLRYANAGAVVGVSLAGLGISLIAAVGLVGFPTRVVEYQGVPMNSGIALLALVLGVGLMRRAGAAEADVAR